MPITVSDTFTRSNTSTGTLGSTETGLVLSWQNPSSWAVISNSAEVNGTTSSPAWVQTFQPDANILIGTENDNGPGVAFWVKDSTNFWMAWLRSNRYLASQSTTCNSCTDCSFGGCNVASYSGCSKSSSTALAQSYSGCGSCSAGSCSTSSVTCSANGNGTFQIYTYASCGGGCTNRTNYTKNCSTTNTCGNTTTGSTNCVASCTATNSNRRCGTRTCGYTSVSCGGSCGSTGRSNRNCAAVCSGCTATYNAASSGTSCNICGSTTSNNYDYEYYIRVDRVVNGSATNVTNYFYADLAGSSGYFSNIRVVTSGSTYQVLGYTDGVGATSVSDTGVVNSGVSDYAESVGHGLVLGALGSASPGSGTRISEFSVTYEPLGGDSDSVGIIVG